MTRRDEGFVLIEMLAALIVTAIAAIACLKISSEAALRMGQAKTLQRASLKAHMLLDAERLKSVADLRQEELTSEDGHLKWTVQVQRPKAYPVQSAEQPRLAQVDVNVWASGKLDDKVSVSAIFIYGASR